MVVVITGAPRAIRVPDPGYLPRCLLFDTNASMVLDGTVHDRAHLALDTLAPEAASGSKIVEVSEAFGILRRLFIRGEDREYGLAANGARCLFGFGFAGVHTLSCFQVLVIIAGNHDRLLRVFFVQRHGDRSEVARVECGDGRKTSASDKLAAVA